MHIMSILVKNHPGVLVRVAWLFSRRGYNIHNMTAGPVLEEELSRMFITVECNEDALEEIILKLYNLIDVQEVQKIK